MLKATIMIELENFSKENITKIYRTLLVIKEFIELKPKAEQSVIIPKQRFEENRIKSKEVKAILKKLSEEVGAFNVVVHPRPTPPGKEYFFSSPSPYATAAYRLSFEISNSIGWSKEQREAAYKEAMGLYNDSVKEYEEKYADTIEISVIDKNKFHELFGKVEDEYNKAGDRNRIRKPAVPVKIENITFVRNKDEEDKTRIIINNSPEQSIRLGKCWNLLFRIAEGELIQDDFTYRDAYDYINSKNHRFIKSGFFEQTQILKLENKYYKPNNVELKVLTEHEHKMQKTKNLDKT